MSNIWNDRLPQIIAPAIIRGNTVCSSNETFNLRCNELTQAQYLDRRGYNLRLLNQEIQRVHAITHTNTNDSPTRIPLVVGVWGDTTPPFAKYHIFFTNTFTFSHPINFELRCLNTYLFLPSYVLTSRKSAKWTSDSRSESELSINVMMLRTVQSPLFSRKIVENQRYAILTGSSLSYLMGGGRFGNPEARCGAYCSLRNEMKRNQMERNEMKICSFRNENL